MKRLSAVFFLFLVTASLPASAQTAQAPAEPAPDDATAEMELEVEGPDSAEAAYAFAVAKIALARRDVGTALDQFRHAVELEPEDPYIRLEYADLLMRLAQRQRSPSSRESQYRQAAEQVDRARELAPENLDVLSATGDVYMALADYQDSAAQVALEALEKVRAEEPWNLSAMVSLGQLYRVRGNAEAAADVFAEAVRYTPNNRILYSFLAETEKTTGDVEAYEAALEQILRLDPLDREARTRLVDSRSQRGEHATALEALESLPESLQGDAQLGALAARELYLNDRPQEALEKIDQTSRNAESDRLQVFLGNLRAAVLVDLGRDEDALRQYRELLDLDPDNPELVRGVARQLVDEGRREEAIEVLVGFVDRNRKVEDADPQRRQAVDAARLSLALLYAEGEQWGAARTVLEPLLDAADEGTRVAGVLTLAETLFRSGKTGKALALLDRRAETADTPALLAKQTELLLRDDQTDRARDLLARVREGGELEPGLAVVQAFHQQERWRDTLAILESLSQSYRDETDPLFLLGAAAERVGDPSRAAEAFQTLLERHPDHAPTLNYLGYMWADLDRNLEQALDMIRRAVELDPDNGAYLDSLGWAYYRLGRYEEAREHLQRAARLVPEDPVIFDHLGDLFVALGDAQKAAEFYRRALNVADGGDLDPVQVRRKLDELETE